MPEGVYLIHLWADADRSAAFHAAIRMGFQNEVGTNDSKDELGMKPLDRSIKQNASGIAEYFFKAGRLRTSASFVSSLR